MEHLMRIAVGFATSGRAEVLHAAVSQALNQSRPAEKIVICYTKAADITGLSPHERVTFVLSEPGLPRQRNVILKNVWDCDVVLFLDDDFLASHHYVDVVSRIFAGHDDIVAATGRPIADGVKGPGIAVEDALQMIATDRVSGDLTHEPAPHSYGCNMAIRLSTAYRHDLWFDERLPLYGWSEDVDFTHRIAHFGRLVKLNGARGVHLGTKKGRTSGRRLGYSQVANPIYLRAKGSFSWSNAASSVGRNLAANAVRAVFPEPYIDRRGRLLGNALAFADLVRGRLAPERVLEF
jgi:hypothetical protein